MTLLRRRLVLVPVFVLVATACVDESPGPAYAQSAGWADDGQGEELPVGVEADGYADTDPSALTDFRSTLDPHGAWVDDSTYGTVWVPNAAEVGPDFAPYVSHGSWAYDDEDYVWVSSFDWGWVPFHYGRWTWVEGRRWVWIPGREYAGAWVSWRVGPDGYDYVGWGPMAPMWGWREGVAYGFGVELVRPGPLVFCPRQELFSASILPHIVAAERAAIIASETRPYVRAEPRVAGHPVIHGPPPGAIGIEGGRIVHVSPNDRGAMRARQYARPATAQVLGARAPVPHVVHFRGRGGIPRGGPGPMPMPRGGGGGHGGHGRH